MILLVLRAVFTFSVTLGALSGNPVFAPFWLISGAILFFTDGWALLIGYFVLGLILLGISSAIF